MLAWLTAGWMLGLVLAATAVVDVPPSWSALAALALGAGVALAGRGDAGPTRRATAALAACGLLAGLAAGPRPPADIPEEPPHGLCRIVADVTRVLHGRRETTSVVRVRQGRRIEDGRAVPAGARLAVRGALPVGARVRLLARVGAPRARYNPSPHPRWPGRRIAAYATPRADPAVEARAPLQDALEAARARVRAAIDRTLSRDVAGLARALALGDSGAVPEDTREAVRAAGLAHVLAVSGLHVTLVAAAVVALLRRLALRLPALAARFDVRRASAGCGVPLALAYAAFAGGAPSAWRAALTAAIGWALVAAGRRPAPWAVAAAAVLALSLADPTAAVDPGLLLSVLATAALVSDRDEGPPELGLLAGVKALARASARATIVTAPLVVWCFGELPASAVIANVLLLPLASIVLVPLSSVHAAVATVAPPLAAITAAPLEAVARAFVGASRAIAALLPPIAIPPPDVAQGVALAAGCFGVLLVRRRRTRAVVVALSVAGVLLAEAHLRATEPPPGWLRVTALDVGQGDALLVDLPDGSSMLVDGGGGAGPDPGRHVLAPLLWARRRARVDLVVLTHPHPDHHEGLDSLHARVPFGEIWDSGQAQAESPDGPVAAWLERARRRGVPVRGPASLCGRPRTFGGAVVEVIWPCPGYDPGLEPNDNSLVLRVTFGRRRLLLTGDLERRAEAALLASGRRLDADVLKVGHHGSRTSTTPAFLAAVSPRVAVLSCGRDNRHGHPHAEVVARLVARGVTVGRTDRHGGVTVRTDGERLRVDATVGGSLAALP